MTSSDASSAAPSDARACGCPDFTLSRRRFLATTAAAAGVMTGAQMFGDAFRQVAYGAAPGGNVVVVLSLRGGADGLSMVVPRGADHDPAHQRPARHRGPRGHPDRRRHQLRPAPGVRAAAADVERRHVRRGPGGRPPGPQPQPLRRDDRRRGRRPRLLGPGRLDQPRGRPRRRGPARGRRPARLRAAAHLPRRAGTRARRTRRRRPHRRRRRCRRRRTPPVARADVVARRIDDRQHRPRHPGHRRPAGPAWSPRHPPRCTPTPTRPARCRTCSPTPPP